MQVLVLTLLQAQAHIQSQLEFQGSAYLVTW